MRLLGVQGDEVVRPGALDEVCSGGCWGGNCNASPVEACCGYALCRECYQEHRQDDCDDLEAEVRREMYPDGCDCTMGQDVCPVHARRVEAEVARRAGGAR